MKFDYHRIKKWPIADVNFTYSKRDTILYALGVGVGVDNLDQSHLKYIYEGSDDFSALPTMVTILGNSTSWLRKPETGIDYVQVLHGEQGINIHRNIPVEGELRVSTKVTGIADKGPSRGAMIFSEKKLFDSNSGELLATTTATTVARANGGYGGPSDPTPKPHLLPEEPADFVCDLPTQTRTALIYRLSGDYNPLHADPEIAKKAGFEKPILHGLCTLGIAGHAILKTCCNYDATRLRALRLRFSAPVFPGETIRTEIWQNNETISFKSKSIERDQTVLSNGYARVIN